MDGRVNNMTRVGESTSSRTGLNDGAQTVRNEDAGACLLLEQVVDVPHQLCLSMGV